MPKKLLLADDSVTIQRVIELTFADEDIQVVAVGDGQQAIARIDADRPDVVLADIGMPERDGYEVAAHVKSRPETAHIPVLLLTGAFEPVDEARARASGCDGVLVKPFEPQMVIHRVKDLLAGHRPASLWGSTAAAPAPAARATAAGERGPSGEPGAPRPETAAATADAHADAGAAQTAAAAPGAPPRGGRSIESLDDYFDRLDAAFSSESAPTPAAPVPFPAAPARPGAAPDYDFGSWDLPAPARAAAPAAAANEPAAHEPSAAGTSAAPEPVGESAADVTPAAAPASPDFTPSERAQAAPGFSLADAFDALLAAERRAAAQAAAPGLTVVDDKMLDEIVTRVLARMTDQTVKATVLDIAERLVREEIDRIKQQAKL